MLNPASAYFYLLAYVVVTYIRPQEYLPAFVDKPIVPGLLGLATILWLVAQKKNFEAAQHRLMPGLVVAMFLSVLLTGWVTGALIAVTEFAPTMVLFYLVATSVDSVKRFREMCLVLTAVCCVLTLHGIGQLADEEGIGWTGAKMIQGRITYLGFLNDPNDLAMAFVITLPLTLYLASTSGSFILSQAYRGAAALIAYGIFLCNSRGSLLAVAAMLFTYSVRRFGWARSLLVAPVLALPMILLSPSRLGEISADEDSAAGRVDAWYEGMQMFRSGPLFGIGKGFFTEYNPLTAHNSFVLAFAEMGLVGYFFWLGIVFLTALMLFRLIGREQPVTVSTGDSASTAPSEADTAAWADWQHVSRALMYSYAGAMVTIFFLSRTYIAILFLLIALIVATHQSVRARWPLVEPVLVRGNIMLILMLEVASIIGLWLLTRVLLNV